MALLASCCSVAVVRAAVGALFASVSVSLCLCSINVFCAEVCAFRIILVVGFVFNDLGHISDPFYAYTAKAPKEE